MEPPDDNEPVVKVASAASKQTQRERSFLGTRILFHGHATCHESWKEGTYRLPTSVPLERIRRNKKYKIFTYVLSRKHVWKIGGKRDRL